jgi:hypothetical protein
MILKGCPICGYGCYQINTESDIGKRCQSCGCGFDIDYDNNSSDVTLQRIRNDWVNETGGEWYADQKYEPIDWSSHSLMKASNMEYPLIPTLMAFYYKGLINDEFVKQWADEHLESENDDFDHLMLLSLNGASYCSKLSGGDFPTTRIFSFIEEFALRAHQCDTNDQKLVDDFMLWFTFNYHYGSDDPMIVGILSDIDQIIDDTGLDDARSYFLKVIQELKVKTEAINKQLWDEIK